LGADDVQDVINFETAMKSNSDKIIVTIVLAISICFLSCGCGHSSVCSRFDLNGKKSRGIFGCYIHYATFIGGFVGGIDKVDDQRSYVLITTDSLFYDHHGDSTFAPRRFTVTWREDVFGKPYADINLSGEANISISWQNDSLSIGQTHSGLAEGGNGGLFVKCCR
jgi:hypothetical protein